jgi:hypothetical protein
MATGPVQLLVLGFSWPLAAPAGPGIRVGIAEAKSGDLAVELVARARPNPIPSG